MPHQIFQTIQPYFQSLNSGNDTNRQCFKKVKYEVDYILKTSYNNFFDSLVGDVDDSLSSNSSRPDKKKFFSYLKKCRQDSQGSASLKKKKATGY